MSVQAQSDPLYPFSRFRDDERQYSLSRKFWLEAFEEALGTKRVDWQPWASDPLHEGTPIFSIYSGQNNKGIVIQQCLPSDDSVWFKCWVSVFGDGEDEDEEIPYLFIEAPVHMESRRRAIYLMKKWLVEDINKSRMSDLSEKVMENSVDERPAGI
ncbi:hypothetical protein F1643_08440 [Azospirillum sp. INR13]|uniref:hypothetical protein n=1 Tax=Azospirillum sp. INR13 TaxID=2596919 RepID=UPI0018920A06|nr:hypothetical protein [Azospirillum sp. INR13]MBF5094507.1 hypothetical protein [Azospirillum sp. INR13]